VVLETPITASAAQIETIASHVPPDTTRVTQPRGDRIVGLDITP
jgi:carbonic anhydrase